MRLGRRAGRVIVGVSLTRSAVRERRAAAILVADDLSSKRRDEMISGFRRVGVDVYEGWTKDELGELAGRSAVAMLTITDGNLARGIADLMAEEPVSISAVANRELEE